MTLGGNKQPDTWESLTEKREALLDEARDTYRRLIDAGHQVGTKKARKTWPWPIQTQVARWEKDLGRIDTALLMMNSPTPTPTPTPTLAECEEYLEDTSYLNAEAAWRAGEGPPFGIGAYDWRYKTTFTLDTWEYYYGEQRAYCQERVSAPQP